MLSKFNEINLEGEDLFSSYPFKNNEFIYPEIKEFSYSKRFLSSKILAQANIIENSLLDILIKNYGIADYRNERIDDVFALRKNQKVQLVIAPDARELRRMIKNFADAIPLIADSKKNEQQSHPREVNAK